MVEIKFIFFNSSQCSNLLSFRVVLFSVRVVVVHFISHMLPQQHNSRISQYATPITMLLRYGSLSLLSPLGVWELACPALSMLARRQSARVMFIEMGGVGHVAGVLTRLGMSPQVCVYAVSSSHLHRGHCTALHCTALHCTALHCTALHCTALHCSVPHTVQLIAVSIKYSRVVKYRITPFEALYAPLYLYFNTSQPLNGNNLHDRCQWKCSANIRAHFHSMDVISWMRGEELTIVPLSWYGTSHSSSFLLSSASTLPRSLPPFFFLSSILPSPLHPLPSHIV